MVDHFHSTVLCRPTRGSQWEKYSRSTKLSKFPSYSAMQRYTVPTVKCSYVTVYVHTIHPNHKNRESQLIFGTVDCISDVQRIDLLQIETTYTSFILNLWMNTNVNPPPPKKKTRDNSLISNKSKYRTHQNHGQTDGAASDLWCRKFQTTN